MSDDMWRDRRDRDDFSEYGSLFDDAEPTENLEEIERRRTTGQISVGDSDTGSLPHWTEPPTREVPRLDVSGGEEYAGDEDELDVWSSFSSEAPVWKDDEPTEAVAPVVEPVSPRTTGQHRRVPDARVTGPNRRVRPRTTAGAGSPAAVRNVSGKRSRPRTSAPRNP